MQKEDKERKRKKSYEKKKWDRYQERSRALRDATGVNGFAALYRVLGLPGTYYFVYGTSVQSLI